MNIFLVKIAASEIPHHIYAKIRLPGQKSSLHAITERRTNMKTLIFVRIALWSLCVYIFVACGQQPEAQSFTSSNNLGQEAVASNDVKAIQTIGATVYVCNSSGEKKYHYKGTCRGLSGCKHEVVTMGREAAEKTGLELCKWED